MKKARRAGISFEKAKFSSFSRLFVVSMAFYPSLWTFSARQQSKQAWKNQKLSYKIVFGDERARRAVGFPIKKMIFPQFFEPAGIFPSFRTWRTKKSSFFVSFDC
jgi:hypothetical protein